MTSDFRKQEYGAVTDAQCKVQPFLCTASRHIVLWKLAIAALVFNFGRTNLTAANAIPPREQRLVHFKQGAGWAAQFSRI
jgi:hypothetical protein